jgi:hypothetical protein
MRAHSVTKLSREGFLPDIFDQDIANYIPDSSFELISDQTLLVFSVQTEIIRDLA